MRLLVAFVVLSCSWFAQADCVGPAGVAGATTWRSTPGDIIYCDGTNWLSTKFGRITLRSSLTDASSVIIPNPDQAHAIKGNIFYIINNSILYVLDSSTITNVTVLGQFSIPELTHANRAIIEGDYLYVMAQSRFLIFDISSPTSPQLVGSLEDSTNLAWVMNRKVVIVGNFAYVLNGTRLVVINITDKAAPVVASNLVVANAAGIASDGTHVYLSRSNTGLTIIDVSNPSVPTIVSSFSHPNIYNGLAIAVSGNYVYIVSTSGGGSGNVATYNVTDRANPSYVANITNTMGSLEGVTEVYRFGGYLYTIQSNGRNSLNFINTYSLASPAAISFVSGSSLTGVTGANCTKISISSSRVVCTQNNEGTIHFFNSTAQNGILGTDTPVNFSDKLGGAIDVTVSAGYAYIAAANSARLTIADVSDPLSPSLSGSVFHGSMSSAKGLVLDGTSAYVITANFGYHLSQINVSNPAAPSFAATVQSFSSNYNPFKIRLRDGVRYWTSSSNRRFTSSSGSAINTTTSVNGFAFSNTSAHAYVCRPDSSELVIFNIATPASMSILGTVTDPSLSGCGHVESSGNYVFVASINAPANISIWDISSPASPTKVGVVENTFIGSIRDMKVVGNYIYVTSTSRFSIFDMSSKTAPVLLDSQVVSSGVSGFAVQGDFVYVANSTSKLEIYEVRPPIALGTCALNGQYTYDTVAHAYKFCTNSVYFSMGPVPGSGGSGCSSPVGQTGEIKFDTSLLKMRYCNGTSWVNAGLD